MRNIRVGWFSWVIAVGLACWIVLSGRSIVAQQNNFEPNKSSVVKPSLVAQVPTELIANVDKSKLSAADVLKSIPSSNLPIKVSVGLHISNLADINQTSETFFPPEQQHYSRITIGINIKRNYGFYLLKVMVPFYKLRCILLSKPSPVHQLLLV